MKKLLERWVIVGLSLVFIVMTVIGCASGNNNNQTSNKSEEKVYPISIEGKEILVGETKICTLLDEGFKVTVSEMTANKQIHQYEIDPEAELKAKTYYTGGSIWLTDSIFAHISLATGEKNMKMQDSVIARIEFTLTSEDKTYLDKIQFNGVPVSEISREKVKEIFPDFIGDENMWFSPATMREYKYFMSFSNQDGMLHNFYAEKSYDVDWTNKN